MSAMKKIKDFCDVHSFDFNALDEVWIQTGKDK